MKTVEQIKQAIQKLGPQELAEVRRWFVAFDSTAWDQQIKADAAAGKLDALAGWL